MWISRSVRSSRGVHNDIPRVPSASGGFAVTEPVLAWQSYVRQISTILLLSRDCRQNSMIEELGQEALKSSLRQLSDQGRAESGWAPGLNRFLRIVLA
jgi:hypothetical protein